MKTLTTIVIVVLFLSSNFSQNNSKSKEDIYESSDEIEYYNNIQHTSFIPQDSSEILKIPYQFIKIKNQNNSNEFESTYEWTEYSRKLNDLRYKVFNNYKMDQHFEYGFLDENILLNKNLLKKHQDSIYEKHINGYISRKHYWGELFDSDSTKIFKKEKFQEFYAYQERFLSDSNFFQLIKYIELKKEKVGPISKVWIICHDKINNKELILYEDSKYDDFVWGRSGYWLALTDDNWKTWRKYYTGLSECHPYFIRREAKNNFWINDSTFQVESAIVRQMGLYAHPGGPPDYENLGEVLLQLNINQIIIDSDQDGLTDIEEQKMMLDPHKKDTDGDGVIDSIDKNPRFTSKKTDRSILYETIIEGNIRLSDTCEIDLSDKKYYENSNKNTIENTYLIVSNDTELKSITPSHNRYIILTSEEFELHCNKYQNSFSQIYISPMFKCDNFKNTFKLGISRLTSHANYVIIRKSQKWLIFIISFSVS